MKINDNNSRLDSPTLGLEEEKYVSFYSSLTTTTNTGGLSLPFAKELVTKMETDEASLAARQHSKNGNRSNWLSMTGSTTMGDHDQTGIYSSTLIERRRGTSLYLASPSSSPSSSSSSSSTTMTLNQPSDQKTLMTKRSHLMIPQQKLQPQYSILAQIERQNALLEKDPKSIYIRSNELRGHYTTVQQLVTDYQPLSSPPLSNDGELDGFLNDNEEQQEQQYQVMDWTFWQALIQDPIHVAKKTPHLLSTKLKAGIPSHARGEIWQAICQSACLHLETVYGQLCGDRSPYERMIQRDLTRTFPNIDMFKQENGSGQLAMRRILVAYSLYDAHVGYCQGLAFLVGPLLMNMPEPQAFCVFVRMMETYEMRSMFTVNMEGLQLRLYQFSCLLEEFLPDLAAHLNMHSIHAAMYASQWFLTLFAYCFPMGLVTRIYDVLFVEGATETMMRVALAMLHRSKHIILAETEFEDLLDCVATKKLCAPYMEDWSDAICDAMSFSNSITRQKLDQLEHQYSQQGQQEKKKTQQVLASRLGSFWRRKSTRIDKNKQQTTTLERSISDGSKCENKRRSKHMNATTSATTRDIRSIDNRYSSPAATSFTTNNQEQHHDDVTEELLQALEQLRKEHSRTIDELHETRMDKKDVESERDALKMTIMELERRYQHPLLLDSNHSLTSNNTISSSSLCEKDTTLVDNNDIQDTLTMSPSLPSLSPPCCSPLSDDIIRTCSTSTGGDLFPDTSDEEIDDSNLLRSELVRVKVEHFEAQQQSERLAHEVDDLQSRLDMVNEGQLALVDKLVMMKSEMDELLQEKKRRDEQWLDLENNHVCAQRAMMERVYELETALAATKVRLAELEASSEETQNQQTDKELDLQGSQVKSNRIGRSASLYGRVWHVISPRSHSSKSPST
ncbi:rab-GTPase-TBC domain-containing protein [Halteromyces radiatus]|uniref:rab-GTPase-TBC domain-containing protein n=1 Tax=Halteromyces radiatus TaxID=101107 RepID=UPI00222008B5|nr:rab-GTPase-TBC domain-containing protein [Halteromyces radiatus]KAI8092925.1 rab-GTPase-TBC domain-containing protein [Halteromyces radiatus]